MTPNQWILRKLIDALAMALLTASGNLDDLIDPWAWIRRQSKMKAGKTQAATWEAAVKLLPVAV